MNRIDTIDHLEVSRAGWPGPVVLVPTMGSLHQGHLALIGEARRIAGDNGTVVVSIFVNPLQFDRQGDLDDYPRDLEEDLAACRDREADFVFTPTARGMYAADHSVAVHESLLTRHLCGAARPGHFDGVCTVVLKLFNVVRPTHAVFGKKDYQQLAIIRRMVRDLALRVEVTGMETVREGDGLALSSRNRNLDAAHRADAPRIRRALLAGRDLRSGGEQRPEEYLRTARHHLENGAPDGFRIDYLELVDPETLQPLPKVAGPAVLATAVFYGEVRLIDNVEF
jgi:pantoate--beta-alanine ligase